MKTALITTLFNEADSLAKWWDCIVGQTAQPDEIVIVDGGSSDGTWEMLQTITLHSRVPVRLEQQRCNIAAGRNIAIRMTDAEIIASTDAGSFPRVNWFAEITRSLLDDPGVDAVGGRSENLIVNDFQRLVASFLGAPDEPTGPGEVYPSSRNIAFRRKVWSDVGGYPEWLTLTAEDALFNRNLHKIGCRFRYNADAVVEWPIRENRKAHFKMLYNYGYGAAEAQLFGREYLVSMVVSVFPPLLLARHRTRGLWFRYRQHLWGSAGWIAGLFRGHRPPPGWKRVEGVYLSPAAQQSIAHSKPPGAR